MAKQGWKGPRPVALRLYEAVMLDIFPDSTAAIADFWITDQQHYEALYYPIRAGEITLKDLDRVLGDPAAITKLVNKSPSNPHKGIVFGSGQHGLSGKHGLGQVAVGPHIIGSGIFQSGNWGMIGHPVIDHIWTGQSWVSDEFGAEPKIYPSYHDAKEDMPNVPFKGHFVAILFIGEVRRR